MITIHELSRDVYTEIMRVMPKAITDIKQEYDTVTITLSFSVDLDITSILNRIRLKSDGMYTNISFKDFHYITIS